ncbi:MAG: SMC-Scp complex subunit ScpB [Verrucomicrobia bacterium]|nr:SMC-Scp complex subunit ScpB [Verrucomicrobiota bacterium]
MELKFILESLLFAAQKPLSPHELKTVLSATADQTEDETARALKKTPTENIVAALEELQKDHGDAGRSYRLICVAGAWQFVGQPEYAPWLRSLLGVKIRPARLSQPSLETLSIIAYRQPVTRAEIEQVRGVAVDGVMQTLLERGLVEQTGRAEVVGRPSLYCTTPAFLEYFGLRALDDLPAADELRRIVVQKPESLLTVDPGLATAPPDALAQVDASAETTGEDAPRTPESGDVASPAEANTATAADTRTE